MQRTIRRRAESLANDERILDAAVTLIADRGVDGVSVVELARAAGLTTGAVYARYTDLPELLADLWVRRCADLVDGLIAEAAAFAAAWPALDPGRLAAFLRCTPERYVAFELIAVAHRIEELGDVVPSRLATRLQAAGMLDTVAEVGDPIAIGLLGLALGSIAHGRYERSLEADAPAIAGWVRIGGARTWSVPPPPPTPRTEIRFVPTSPDVVLTDRELRRLRLLDAAVAVVARSGVARATFRRISRASGYAHTAVYQEYGGLHELLVDLVRTFAASAMVVAPDRSRYTDTALEAALIAGGMAASGRTIRRLTVEFLFARRDPEMGGLIAAADRDRYDGIATLLAGAGGPGHATIVPYRYAHRAFNVGICALEETVGGLAPIDWRPFQGALQAGALAAAGIPATT